MALPMSNSTSPSNKEPPASSEMPSESPESICPTSCKTSSWREIALEMGTSKREVKRLYKNGIRKIRRYVNARPCLKRDLLEAMNHLQRVPQENAVIETILLLHED